MEQLVYRLNGTDLRDRPFAFAGAGEGIRTPDPLITNQLLYRTELRQPNKFSILAYTMTPCNTEFRRFFDPKRQPNRHEGLVTPYSQ